MSFLLSLSLLLLLLLLKHDHHVPLYIFLNFKTFTTSQFRLEQCPRRIFSLRDIAASGWPLLSLAKAQGHWEWPIQNVMIVVVTRIWRDYPIYLKSSSESLLFPKKHKETTQILCVVL